MFSPIQGGTFGGPSLDLGLTTVVAGKAFLTEEGSAFAAATIPAVDEPAGVNLFCGDHLDILARAIINIPGELMEIQRFLAAVDRSSGVQEDIDRQVAADHAQWTEAQVVTHRAAMVGRLSDIDVIDVESTGTGKATIVPAPYFDSFLRLINVKKADQ
jgi:hypothetical protein